ncbi:hypothetical protein GCM10009612_31440 [Streptomyces beijiangensis]
MFSLIHFVIIVILSIIGFSADIAWLAGLYSLAVLLPALAVTARRLHDTDRSGWLILIGIIPLVGAIILIVFLATEGKPEANPHGPNPKLAPAF